MLKKNFFIQYFVFIPLTKVFLADIIKFQLKSRAATDEFLRINARKPQAVKKVVRLGSFIDEIK